MEFDLEVRHGDGVVRTVAIPSNGLSIGRSQTCGLVLEDLTVSKSHAQVVPSGFHLLLTDLASSGGTFVGAQRVTVSSLDPGAEFRVGPYTLRVGVRQSRPKAEIIPGKSLPPPPMNTPDTVVTMGGSSSSRRPPTTAPLGSGPDLSNLIGALDMSTVCRELVRLAARFLGNGRGFVEGPNGESLSENSLLGGPAVRHLPTARAQCAQARSTRQPVFAPVGPEAGLMAGVSPGMCLALPLSDGLRQAGVVYVETDPALPASDPLPASELPPLVKAGARALLGAQTQALLKEDRDRWLRLAGAVPVRPDPMRVVRSPSMLDFAEVVRRATSSTSPALLVGDEGTGKEEVARFIHKSGPRSEGPCVVVDAGMTAPERLAVELFGHEGPGAGGGVEVRPGLFDLADTGTVIVRRIDRIPLDVQKRLAQALSQGNFQRSTTGALIPLKSRVLFTSVTGLEAAVAGGQVSGDLAARLSGQVLNVPSLRNRPGDVEGLALDMARRHARRSGRLLMGIDRAALQVLEAHSWPGNVRELDAVIAAAVAREPGDKITAESLALSPKAS